MYETGGTREEEGQKGAIPLRCQTHSRTDWGQKDPEIRRSSGLNGLVQTVLCNDSARPTEIRGKANQTS